MDQIGIAVTQRINKLRDYGVLESYNGNQFRTRIILECFIITYDTTSLPKVDNRSGSTLLDVAEQSVRHSTKNKNGNEWKNIFSEVYKIQGWNDKQRKIFIKEICNNIFNFDDVEDHVNKFIVDDDGSFNDIQNIIPSKNELMSQDTTKINDPHKRTFNTTYEEKFQHIGKIIQQNDENLECKEDYTCNVSNCSNINILQPRKKQRKEG